MKFSTVDLPDVVLVEPTVFGDDRGFFMETWEARKFAAAGITATFVQDNHSRSSQGILRGMHYQLTQPQGKLVRVTQGAVYDVVVDIRQSSPAFGRWYGVELSEKNRRMLWVPPGFAHGFYVLSDNADFVYKCSEYYHPEDEHCIAWNDPDIGIVWPDMDTPPTQSKKDQLGLSLQDAARFP